MLEGGDTLHGSSGRERGVTFLQGRQPVHVVEAKTEHGRDRTSDDRWAIRHFARGGRILSGLLGDRYLRIGTPRPFREAVASEIVRSRGISTPRVVAAATYWSVFSYRGDLATEFIPRASDLVEVLFGNVRKGAAGAAERQEALRATGKLIAAMARAGIMHPDLHAGNVLLQWEGSAPRPFLMDLDRCKVQPEGTPIGPTSIYRRLKRSLEKWEGRARLRISEREWAALRSGTAG
jgi:hypothetical protein